MALPWWTKDKEEGQGRADVQHSSADSYYTSTFVQRSAHYLVHELGLNDISRSDFIVNGRGVQGVVTGDAGREVYAV
jgi:hypothetical protein